jgi:hypothetical protein
MGIYGYQPQNALLITCEAKFKVLLKVCGAAANGVAQKMPPEQSGGISLR